MRSPASICVKVPGGGIGATIGSSGQQAIEPSGRRIRLSAKAVLDAREADEVREYAEREDAAPPEGFGSLADKLRGALGSRNK